MCGIAGYYAKNQEIAEPLVRKMSATMQHRGPDNMSFYSHQNVGLGHNRLSLIDLDVRSNQPFQNDLFALVYNGEIYNFIQLKQLLEKEGQQFVTTSDTEVLFVALQHWGIEKTLPLLEGMFAFGWLNKSTLELCVARDKLGIKPLFYCKEPRGFAFASELKALLAAVEYQQLHQVRTMLLPLRSIENSPHYTPFEHIFQLKPGHWLSIDLNLNVQERAFFHPRQYVDEAYFKELDGQSTADIVNRADALMNLSVQGMLVADASIGAFVSGGIDSSLISAIASKYKKVQLYTANIKGKFSEFEFAQQLAKHVNAPLKQYDFEPQMFLPQLAKATWHYEAPLVVHPNSVPFGNVAKLAFGAQEKAVLTGEGSDELFLGYPGTAFYRYAKYLMWPYTGIKNLYKRIPGLTRYISIDKGNPVSDVINQMNGFEKKEAEALNRAAFGFVADANQRREQTMTLDMLQTHLHSLLWRNDRIGMMHSIESRFPFLDDNLVRFGINLPVKFKLMKNNSFYNMKHPFVLDKGVVRKVAERYLPDALVNKKKQGFPVYGLGNCKFELEFFKDGFWQDFTGMSQQNLAFMMQNSGNAFVAKLAAAEIWGQLFVRQTPYHLVQEKINQHASMKF
ncbi:MAG: asparagine synthase (glutamine-hydrolyzing) [Bacteroidetes bacterium]|nr:MAG: asparagine synthase (glutamine-hydrolyzing) [Bacteroidota bacterium]